MGKRKLCERILTDIAKANPGFSVSLLRYFNPVGAHASGLIGESSSGIPNNLMPYVTQVAKGKLEKLRIFGNDYPTVDGTGKGTSVLQIVKAFEEGNGIQVPFEIVARRPGDIAECYADVSKANRELEWTAKRDIVQMCKDAWRFDSKAQDQHRQTISGLYLCV